MFDAQIIKTGGDDIVVLSRRDYEALLARAGDLEAENIVTSRILAETKAQAALPVDVVDRIIDGENRVKVLMDHRNLTQAELARLSGLSQPFISKVIRGEVGLRHSKAAVANALNVSVDFLDGRD
jgi:hypothetical protein